jgi:hypothetical protein
MSATNIRAYWPLIKTVIVPVGIMKIILFVMMVCFAITFFIALFLKKGLDGAAPVLFASISIYFFFLLIILPSQAMTVISSKSLRYLTDFRKFYFVLAVLLSMAVPVVVIIFKWFMAEPAKEICAEGVCTELKSIHNSIGLIDLRHFGLQVWLLSSAYIIGLFFLAYKLPLLQGLIFVTFAGLGPILNQLAQWSLFQLILAALFSWLVFGFWWLRLKPQKYFINAYAMNMEQMMSAGTTAHPSVNPTAVAVMNFFSPGSKPASFLGTRLIGMPDGNSGFFRMGLMYLMMILLMLGLFKWIFADNFQNMMRNLGVVLVFYATIIWSYGVLAAICRNIKSSWLGFPGTRGQLLQFIEKRYFAYSIKMMWITPIIAILLNQLSSQIVIDLLSFILGAVSVAVVNAMTFYLALSISTRDNDRKMGTSSWHAINIFLSIVLMVLICVFFKMDYPFLASAILVLIMLINFSLRRTLFKKWQTINFVRVS